MDAFKNRIALIREPVALAECAVSFLGEFFEADLAIWNDHLLPGMHPLRACFYPAIGNHALTKLDGLIKHVHQHPFLIRYHETGEFPEVFRLSDLTTNEVFRVSSLYREVYFHLRIRYQMGIVLPSPHSVLRVIVLNRWIRDFEANDLALAAAIRPLLCDATTRTHEFEDAEFAFLNLMTDPQPGQCIALTPDLRIREMSETALQLLQVYCGASEIGNRLPEVLEKWIQEELSDVVSVNSPECYERRLIAQTVMREGPRQMVVTLVLLPQGPVLLLAESDGLKKSDHMAWDRLTRRKLEILRWVVEGKTNHEIGVILDISDKAVEKHVADLCRVFGVNNRIGLVREYFNH